MQERRQYVRSNGLVLVEYKGLQIKNNSAAFDVSGAGVRLTLDHEVEIGLQMKMEIYLPGSSQPIIGEGQVVWVEKSKQTPKTPIEPGKEYFYTGVKFTVIDDENKAKVTDYVSKKLHKRR